MQQHLSARYKRHQGPHPGLTLAFTEHSWELRILTSSPDGKGKKTEITRCFTWLDEPEDDGELDHRSQIWWVREWFTSKNSKEICFHSVSHSSGRTGSYNILWQEADRLILLRGHLIAFFHLWWCTCTKRNLMWVVSR